MKLARASITPPQGVEASPTDTPIPGVEWGSRIIFVELRPDTFSPGLDLKSILARVV
jgi:hypothetical protein